MFRVIDRGQRFGIRWANLDIVDGAVRHQAILVSILMVLTACEAAKEMRYQHHVDGSIRDRAGRIIFGLRDTGVRATDPPEFRCPKIGTYHGETGDIYGGAGIHPTAGRHAGLDIPVLRGSAVLAPADGVVDRVYISHFTGDTNLEIRHAADGQAPYMITLFAHLIPSSITVKAGQTIQRGQKLAEVAYHGRDPNGISHLHWEIFGPETRRPNSPIRQYNPLALMNLGQKTSVLRPYTAISVDESSTLMTYPLRCVRR